MPCSGVEVKAVDNAALARAGCADEASTDCLAPREARAPRRERYPKAALQVITRGGTERIKNGLALSMHFSELEAKRRKGWW